MTSADIKKNNLEIYDDYAASWWTGETRWVRTLKNMVPARLRFFDRFVDDWSGKSVLDLGCAGGFMAEAIAQKGANVFGIDPAKEAIASAQRHAAETGLAIDYRVGVGEALPYDNGAFDLVVCVDVLEHVSDLDKVLDEVARVLRPGGWFLFDTINRNPVASAVVIGVAERVLGLLPRGTHDPEMFIKPNELRDRLTARGLDVEPFRGLGPAGINGKLDFTFGVTPVTTIIYIGAAQLHRIA